LISGERLLHSLLQGVFLLKDTSASVLGLTGEFSLLLDHFPVRQKGRAFTAQVT
jgi:hypothetical protein